MLTIPSVTVYIRKQEPKRHYERVKTRNPQMCAEGDVYCLHVFHNGKRQWMTVGTNFREALKRRMEKESELILQSKAPAPFKAKATLLEHKERFLEFKQTTKKKDGTPLDAETITAYKQQVAAFI